MPTPISFDASVQSLVVVAIVLCLVVVVMIIVADTAIARVETRPVEIELSFRFVLVPRQHVVAHDVPFFQIASAMEILCIVGAARPIVDCGRRVGAQRTGATSRRRACATAREQGLRRHALLDPFDKSAKRIGRNRTGAAGGPEVDTAVSDTGRAEQTIKALQIAEIRLTEPAIACRHLAVIVNHATRVDELVDFRPQR